MSLRGNSKVLSSKIMCYFKGKLFISFYKIHHFTTLILVKITLGLYHPLPLIDVICSLLHYIASISLHLLSGILIKEVLKNEERIVEPPEFLCSHQLIDPVQVSMVM